MSKNLKKWMAGEFRSSVGGKDACILVGYDSLSGEASMALRTRLRKANVEFKVLRNRVATHALSGTAMQGVSSLIKGPTAVATGGEDALALAKAVVEGVKDGKGFTFRGGLVEGKIVSGEEIRRLAALPGRKELLSLIASAVSQPMTNVACGVGAILTGVARAVEALREKAASGGAAEAPPAG